MAISIAWGIQYDDITMMMMVIMALPCKRMYLYVLYLDLRPLGVESAYNASIEGFWTAA